MRETGGQIIRTFEIVIGLMIILQNQVSCLKRFLFDFRYDSSTGTFTVPSGGDGYYYFSTYIIVQADKYGLFNTEINGDLLCTAWGEAEDTTLDPGPATCSATTYATQGTGVFQ